MITSDDKRIQSTDYIEKYSYGTSSKILHEKKKKEIKCNKILKKFKND